MRTGNVVGGGGGGGSAARESDEEGSPVGKVEEARRLAVEGAGDDRSGQEGRGGGGQEEGAREEDRPLDVEVDEEGESGLGRRTPEA